MDSEMCKLVTPKGAKRNGHPRARWCDDIVKNAGAYWKEQTQLIKTDGTAQWRATACSGSIWPNPGKHLFNRNKKPGVSIKVQKFYFS